jgi:hypothetical protein
VREESHGVKVLTDEEVSLLPDTPYNLWVRGDLNDYVDAPEGSRVEVIGGKVVVSPPPGFPHNTIVGDINYALVRAHVLQPGSPGRPTAERGCHSSVSATDTSPT